MKGCKECNMRSDEFIKLCKKYDALQARLKGLVEAAVKFERYCAVHSDVTASHNWTNQRATFDAALAQATSDDASGAPDTPDWKGLYEALHAAAGQVYANNTGPVPNDGRTSRDLEALRAELGRRPK